MVVSKIIITRLCIVVALLLWVFLVVYPSFPGHPTRDTLTQIAQVHNHCINNWKPALYAYLLMLGESLAANGGVKFGYVVQCGVFGLGYCLIVLSLCKKSMKYMALLLLLPFFGAKGCVMTEVGNDAMAAACYVAFIGLIMYRRTMTVKCMRLSLLIVAFSILWYGMCMRHNSAFCVAVLLAWAIKDMTGSSKRVVAASITCTICFYILYFTIIELSHVEKSYPLKSAIADDLINISILNGTWDEFCVKKQKEQHIAYPPPNIVANLTPEVANFHPCGLNVYGFIEDAKQREADYEEYKRAWISCVKRNPLKYMVLKAYFFQQYLMAGRSIPIIDSYVKQKFKGTEIQYEGFHRHWHTWCSSAYAFCGFIPMISYMTLFYFLFQIYVRNKKYDIFVYDSIYILSANLMYTLTFSIFTLSSTEMRYYIINSTLSLIALSIIFISLKRFKIEAQS